MRGPDSGPPTGLSSSLLTYLCRYVGATPSPFFSFSAVCVCVRRGRSQPVRSFVTRSREGRLRAASCEAARACAMEYGGLSSPVGLCWVARFDYSGRYGDDVAFFLGLVFRLPFLVVVVVVGVCVFFLPPTYVRPPKYRPRLSCFSFEKDYLCGMPIHSSIDTPSLYKVLGVFVPTQPTPPTQHNTAITPNPALQVDPARGDRAR